MSNKRTILDQYSANGSDLGCHFVATSDLPNGTSTGAEVDCPTCAEIEAAYQKGMEDLTKQVKSDIEEVFKT